MVMVGPGALEQAVMRMKGMIAKDLESAGMPL